MIPTWDRLPLLRSCLDALRLQDLTHRVYVVDNGSLDGTAACLAADYPEVMVLGLPANLGFGRAVNLGIEAGDGELVVLLNNDTLAPPEFLAALVAPLVRDAALGCVAGVLVDPDGQTIDAAGVVVDRTLAGFSHLHGAGLADLAGPLEPLGPCGGAAAYRRGVLTALGGFDPEFFAYGEDIDLALRARAAGYRCQVAVDARALHRGSATLGRGSRRQLTCSGWSRGYLLGRYRLAPWVLVLELLVGLAETGRQRRGFPLTSRVRGYRRGRALPARPWDQRSVGLSLRDGLARRARG